MNQSYMLLAAVLYALVGFLIFLALDAEEREAPVPYGELPAVLPLATIRWTIGIVSCGFWLPVFAAAFLSGIGERLKVLPSRPSRAAAQSNAQLPSSDS